MTGAYSSYFSTVRLVDDSSRIRVSLVHYMTRSKDGWVKVKWPLVSSHNEYFRSSRWKKGDEAGWLVGERVEGKYAEPYSGRSKVNIVN